MNRKIIFLDVDGTLVDFDGTMPASAREALFAAQKNGHKLVLCTGRFAEQVYPWLRREIPFDGIITSSGANVKFDGKTVFEHFIPTDVVREATELFRKHGAAVCYHTDDALAATERELSDAFEYLTGAGVSAAEAESLLTPRRLIADGGELPVNVEKIVYYGADRILPEMRKLVSDELIIDPYSFRGVPATSGEVILKGMSKAVGIEKLIAALGVPLADTIAVGDGGNDIPMIRYAGVGVAMGNGSAEVKAAADLVTDSIRADGFAKAFRTIGLI